LNLPKLLGFAVIMTWEKQVLGQEVKHILLELNVEQDSSFPCKRWLRKCGFWNVPTFTLELTFAKIALEEFSYRMQFL